MGSVPHAQLRTGHAKSANPKEPTPFQREPRNSQRPDYIQAGSRVSERIQASEAARNEQAEGGDGGSVESVRQNTCIIHKGKQGVVQRRTLGKGSKTKPIDMGERRSTKVENSFSEQPEADAPGSLSDLRVLEGRNQKLPTARDG